MPEPLSSIGWREWLSLPDLEIPWIKAKVDTGARSSALHALDLEQFELEGSTWVRFEIQPWQRSEGSSRVVTAPLLETRSVRSSSGASEARPVIATTVRSGTLEWVAELTLTKRDQMGFRMLLGRQAIKSKFLVDSGRSYLRGRAPKDVRAANRRIA